MIRTLILLLALCAGEASALTRTEANSKSVTLVLEFPNGECSGTAIGRNVILTAAHCVADEPPVVTVNGTPTNITRIQRDGGDQARLNVELTFGKWAAIGNDPKQGDPVFIFGNPARGRDMLRRGYVAGHQNDRIIADLEIGHGDSGAGVFNERGQVVGIVSGYFYHEVFRVAVVQPVIRTTPKDGK